MYPALSPSILLIDPLLNLGYFSHTHVLISTCWILGSGRGGHPLQISRALCLSASLSSSVLSGTLPATLVALASVNFHLYVLKSQRWLGSAWVPLLLPQSGKFLYWVSWSSCRAHLSCFQSLRDHCPSLSDVQCIESHCFIIPLFKKSCFSLKGNLDWEWKSLHILLSFWKVGESWEERATRELTREESRKGRGCNLMRCRSSESSPWDLW